MTLTRSRLMQWPLAGLAAFPLLFLGGIHGAAAKDSRPLESLKGKTPVMPDLAGIVADETWTKATGKALFWDQQLGSDGNACASCHFNAGADPRITNQLSPGLKAGDSLFGAPGAGDPTARVMASGQPAGPDITLQPNDYPFHKNLYAN